MNGLLNQFADISGHYNLIQELMEKKIADMKQEVEYQCRSILIAKGIADKGYTDYQWRRLARLLEGRADGKTYYIGEHYETPVYEIRYYEPPMPDWTKTPEMPYVVQLGSYQVIPF